MNKINQIYQWIKYQKMRFTARLAAKQSIERPKELLELLKIWESEQEEAGRTEIQELAQNLAELSGIEQVQAVTHIPGDLHTITFYLSLAVNVDKYNIFDTLEELWEVAERMALRSHRRLRESTGEKWYFHVTLDLDKEFSDYPNSNQVVVIAYAEPNNPSSVG